MENDFGSHYTVISCTGGGRNQSSRTAKHITFITSCHANILPETCYVTPWALSPTYSIIIEWTPTEFTLYDETPQCRVVTKHTRRQIGDGGGTTKLKWLEFQYKSNTKMNLEKICEETRVTPTNENYVAVPGQVSMVERICASRSESNQLIVAS